MRSEQNLLRRQDSPKFIRRSMSPIDYINTQSYQDRLKKKDIKVDFGFLNDKKLEKVSIKRRDMVGSRIGKDKVQSEVLDKLQNSNNQQNSFLKANDYSGLEKSSRKFIDDSTNQTDFLKSLDEDSDILKNELNLQSQLYNARKRIFQLQQQLDTKNRKVEEQAQSLRNQYLQHLGYENRQKNYKNQLQKMRIKLVMEQRKNQEYLYHIKKLKILNRNKKQNIPPKQRKMRKNLQNEKELDFFELSPDKHDNLY